MKTHTETKTTAGYALVMAKDGAKLTAAEEQSATLDKEEMQRQARERVQSMMEELRKQSGGRSFSTWNSNRAPMPESPRTRRWSTGWRRRWRSSD